MIVVPERLTLEDDGIISLPPAGLQRMSIFGFRTERASAGSHNAQLGVTGREMPPIRLMPPGTVRYYKLHFLEDGLPTQRRRDGSFYEHPLYPIYIAEEYLRQNTQHPDPTLLDAAKLVMDAALKRAEPFGESLVFWYGADAGVKRAAHRHYSALTQAHYVALLSRFQEVFGPVSGYRKLARRFAHSLAIPVAEGGVMQVRPQGKGVEELPLAMPELVLNGWLSALSRLTRCPDVLRRAGMAGFLDENLDLLEYLLPRYDMPALHNSRYSLSGYLHLRLTAGNGAKITLRNAQCSWSASENFALGTGKHYRWSNFLFQDDVAQQMDGSFRSLGSRIRANLVLSQLAEESAFEFVGATNKPTEVRVEATAGRYDPLASTPASIKWVPLETLAIDGTLREYRVRIGAPWTDLVGYPTNFYKSFDDQNRNVYHPIHVRGLYRLHRYQPRPLFLDMAKRWTRYIARWKSNPLYSRFASRDYSTDVPGALRRYLVE